MRQPLPLAIAAEISRERPFAPSPVRHRPNADVGTSALAVLLRNALPSVVALALAFIPLLHGRRLRQTGFALKKGPFVSDNMGAPALRLGQAAGS